MAKVNNIKRLIAEDFDSDYQDLVRQIAYTTNPFFEQITQAFNKSIDFENLNQDLVYIEAEVDNNGVPKVTLDVRTNLRSKLRGTQIISAENLTSSSLLLGSPFISYSIISGGFRVNQITGLQPNTRYRLTVIIY